MSLPLRGREKRPYFNRAAALALGSGYLGALLGYKWAGVVGAFFGFGFGLAAGCSFLARWRFCRLECRGPPSSYGDPSAP
jgi:hypothetical protein